MPKYSRVIKKRNIEVGGGAEKHTGWEGETHNERGQRKKQFSGQTHRQTDRGASMKMCLSALLSSFLDTKIFTVPRPSLRKDFSESQ